MDAEKLNQALYDKMAAEQERFKHGLLGMTTEEALSYAYEYAPCLPHTRPARRPDTGSGLRVQRVGDDLAVADSLCRPRRRRVQHTASVFLARGTEPGHFQRQAIVQIAAHGTAHNGNAHQPPLRRTTNGKLVASGGLVVAVVGGYKSVGLFQ